MNPLDTEYSGGLRSAEVYDTATGTSTWSATANLTRGRYSHSATLLPTGKVLVPGGEGGGNTAELYDPAAAAWISTGAMNSGRSGHTATLLQSGKVLVAGGAGGAANAEIYDPAAETWTLTGPLAQSHVHGHTTTLLSDGRVLLVGGDPDYASVELFDPATNAWTRKSDMVPGSYTGRFDHTATLLADGHVLAAGGQGAGATAELYDPATGGWSDMPMPAAREKQTATLLPAGQVLVAGDASAPATATLYDPGLAARSAWRPVLGSATPVLAPGARLVAAGSRFRGISEASGGAANSSATDIPRLQLRRLDNDRVRWLDPDPAAGFSDSAVTSLPVTGFPAGPALVIVFTNSMPSNAVMIQVTT